MIQIAVVEDEQTYVDQITEYLRRYQEERKEDLNVTVFRDGDGILADYHTQFDIIFMDIQMKFVDGMTAAEEIRKMDQEVVIIFITNMQQYAIRGYAVDALDYVLKPVNYFAFCERLERAIGRMKKRKTHFVTIPVKGGMVKLDISQVYYVESQGHNLIYHTDVKEYISAGTIKEIVGTLENIHFCQIHKGILVNLEHVDGIEESSANVHGELLPISRSRKNDFMKSLTNYVSEVMK